MPEPENPMPVAAVAIPIGVQLLQALAPIGIDLATKLVEAIKNNDFSKVTPEEWLELMKHKAMTSDERLRAIIAKHFQTQ